MKKNRIAIAFILAALMASFGCAGKVKYPSYYTLNLPAPPDPPGQGSDRVSLAVRQFRSPTYLRQGAIAYKTSPEQIGFYAYHRWATDPRELVTNALVDHLRASGNFAQVKMYDGRPDVACVLSGRLERLEEIDYDGGVKVAVSISAQMTRLATSETVWTNAVSKTDDVGKHDVPAVVAEMNHTMEKTIDELLTPMPTCAASVAPTTASGN